MNFKLSKNKLIIIGGIALILILAFFYGGKAPGLKGELPEPSSSPPVVKVEEEKKDIKEDLEEEKQENSKTEEVEEPVVKESDLEELEPEKQEEIKETKEIEEKVETSPKNKKQEETIEKQEKSEAKNEEQKEEKTEIKEEESLTCTLSVRCNTVFDNIDWLSPEKIEILPRDGVIYAEKKVNFYKGESVFNLLQREMKQAKIHMEFTNTPLYNSAYIDGINNLYEFDCGELSGWMYRVNNSFPKYGSSRYKLEDGDRVEWLYTCDYGQDIGGSNFE